MAIFRKAEYGCTHKGTTTPTRNVTHAPCCTGLGRKQARQICLWDNIEYSCKSQPVVDTQLLRLGSFMKSGSRNKL